MTVRELAKELGKTENYISSIENGREFPSLKTFLDYLLINGFATTPLTRLCIEKESRTDLELNAKQALVNKIYSLNNSQVSFLSEQAKLVEVFALRQKMK